MLNVYELDALLLCLEAINQRGYKNKHCQIDKDIAKDGYQSCVEKNMNQMKIKKFLGSFIAYISNNFIGAISCSWQPGW